jgi:hypothetical protein
VTDIFDASTHQHLAQAPTGNFSFGFAASAKAKDTNHNEFVFVASAGTGAVSTIDARASSGTIHKIVGVTSGGTNVGGVATTPGVETPEGNVTIEPAPDVSISFNDVTESGSTTVTSSNISDIDTPSGFVIDGLAVYYEVNTTAEFTGPVEVCFDYNDDINQNGDPFDDEDLEASFRCLHEEGTEFVDRTSFLDTAANRICANVTSFSQFVVARSLTATVQIDVKPGGSPNTIKLGSKGNVTVAILGSASFDAATVDPSTVTLEGASPAVNKKGKASVYTEDVNFDGFPDLVLQFKISDLQLTTQDAQVLLEGETFADEPFSGFDSVKVIQ